MFVIFGARAETISTTSLKKAYTTAELDQILAAIALYPDGLLLQVLTAATYPAEITQAARWIDMHAGLDGEAAIDAAADIEWNISVKSLLAFPDVLMALASNTEWSGKLGNAFKAQREDVMKRIQYLRRKARATGYLKSDERIKVITTSNMIVIEPAFTNLFYIPYYNPSVVYGSWWSGYMPYYCLPWRGYHHLHEYDSGGLIWGAGIRFKHSRFHGRFDWRKHQIHWRPAT